MSGFRFSVAELISICKAELIADRSPIEFISDIVTDSRHIVQGISSAFIAIKGPRHDGHRFIGEAVNQGICVFIVSDIPEEGFPEGDFTVLKVANTVRALQLIAAAHRSRFQIPVLAITGSNGKTMVKEWLYQLLSPEISIVRSPKSYNSQIGVPLSVCKMSENDALAIFEAGISQPGEMQYLADVIRPDSGIFTNIGTAHDEGFIDLRQKAGEKLQLFASCKKLIYCSRYHEITTRLTESGLSKKLNVFSWGSRSTDQLRIQSEQSDAHGTTIVAEYNRETIELRIPFNDVASVENLIHCWAWMLSEGYSHPIVAERMKRITPVEMRLEVRSGINGCVVINDSYNSDFNSLSIAIDFLEKNKEYSRKTIIMSDILQSGKESSMMVSAITELISRRNITRFIGIGPALSSAAFSSHPDATFFKSTEAFLQQFDLTSFSNEMILLKGARPFGFERIGAILEEKAHETILETDLNALTNNVGYYRSQLGDQVKMMAMVKAFAYGSGSVEIARHLEYHRFDYLAVAYADEGVALRKAGITMPVMVMSAEENNFYYMLRYHLEPEIYSFSSLQRLCDSIELSGLSNQKAIKIHIKVDTGMHRLGFDPADVLPLAGKLLSLSDVIEVASVFSHFSAADDPAFDSFSMQQMDVFNRFANTLEQQLQKPFIRHMANSAAALRLPASHMGMVRLGLGLYGVDPAGISRHLLPVVSLRTSVLQIRTIAAGESVGYSRKAIAKTPRTIATLAAGYADGLNRKLGNGKWSVWIQGHLAPIVGNICMDMCMIDISGLENIHEGDEVEIFGKNLSLTDYAAAMDTIPYEALTSVSSRVKRIYVQQD